MSELKDKGKMVVMMMMMMMMSRRRRLFLSRLRVGLFFSAGHGVRPGDL